MKDHMNHQVSNQSGIFSVSVTFGAHSTDVNLHITFETTIGSSLPERV